MRVRVLHVALVCCLAYSLLIIPFARQMSQRPIAVRLGYMPHATVLKIAFPDFRQLLAQHSVVRVLFYFGTLIDPDRRRVTEQPEFFHMFTTLQNAVRLNPYNMDAYYFTQAAFTWELRKIREVNDMLDYGMEYRTWDADLPFYAGMNAALFLKDYKEASRYLKMAASKSGNPLYTNLAARYLYESAQSKIALAFIEEMEKKEFNFQLKKLYRMRREALQRVVMIEDALKRYRSSYGKFPNSLELLVSAGYLDGVPHDPYGGRFFLTPEGFVRSTSKFAMVHETTADAAGK